MYRAVIKTLEINQSFWTEVTAFTNAYDTFTARYAELVGLGNQRKTMLDGVSRKQKEARAAANSSIMNVAGILKSFAIKNDLYPLIETASICKSDLRRGKLAERLEIMSVILEHAEMHINELEDFGLESEELANAQTVFQAYLVISTEYRNAIILRKQLNRAINRKVKEMDAILKNELDLMIPVVSSENANFLESYQDARSLINYKGGRSSEGPQEGTTPSAA